MMNYLKRRFSHGDLQDELKDQNDYDAKMASQESANSSSTTNSINTNFQNIINMAFSSNTNTPANGNNNSSISQHHTTSTPNSNAVTSQLTGFRKGPSPSAPSSPTKNMSITSSVLNAARGIMNTNLSQLNQNMGISQNNTKKPMPHKDKIKILLVIDDDQTDWSKYFRNRKIFGDNEIRVEQVKSKN